MMRWTVAALIVAALGGTAGEASAAEDIRYEPAPAWVHPIPLPSERPSPGGAVQPLMQDFEVRYGADGDHLYAEFATKVLSAQGLQAAGQFSQTWNPATQTLIIHKLEIVRDGKPIDQLASGKPA